MYMPLFIFKYLINISSVSINYVLLEFSKMVIKKRNKDTHI